MKSFFNIISINTNSYSSENIVVGLLAISSGQIYYGFSKEKLKLINKMVKEKKLESFAKQALKQIEVTVKGANNKKIADQQEIGFVPSIFNENYFSYLNKYSNGLINFSEPQFVNFDFDQDKFNQYFQNFIGIKNEPKKDFTAVSFHQKLKPYFKKEGLSEKADLNYTLDPKKFKKIIQEVQVPLVTKNGSIKIIQEIDFSSGSSTIKNHIYETKMIHESFQKFSKPLNCKVDKINIAFEEPDLKTEQHQLFDLAYSEYKNSFNFIHLDQLNKITDKIINSPSYTKFSEILAGY